MTSTRRRPNAALIVVGVLVVGIAAVVGLIYVSGQRVWSDLDNAADDFGVPAGFTELQRVRSGEAVCFVTCTGGGEAVLTVVLDPGSLSEDEACARIEDAVRELVAQAGTDLEPPFGSYECGFVAPLDGTMRVGAFVARGDDLRLDRNAPWLEDEPVPDLPVVAWVEINSGIE